MLLGYPLIGLSVIVIVTTFPGWMGTPLVPNRVPMFGVGFGLLYLGGQYAIAFRMRSKSAVVLITITTVVVALIAGMVRLMRALDVSPIRYSLVMGVCVSGALLGWAMLKGWIRERD